LGQPLPAFCLKIPTGGGKTLLAAKVVDLVNAHYRRRQSGLVLWVVPSTQIYAQTLRALRDRDHPYRQALDMASAGRTLVLEKADGFAPSDVAESLCVLLLMLPSANRETKEQLKMFQDSGGFEAFFPSEDRRDDHRALLEKIPNLDTFEKQDGFWGRQIKTSLGNTLRLLQPLIIMDEGHKAYSVNARNTLEGFNPVMLVELSATPPKESNVLVEITGGDLEKEDMIKLDLHIENRGSTNWKDTLLAAIEHRRKLEDVAREHEAKTGVYIRPICLIQVERTGKDQRKPGFVHADDVVDYLTRTKTIPREWVAIKTSQKDELKEVDEVGGLMGPDCTIRFIITKQALQEGWDCSFAYVLAILTNPASKTALTQLVGRILRQPGAKKTGNPWLVESYVFCYQRKGQDLLDEIRNGFGQEGLGDLKGRVLLGKDSGPKPGAAEDIFPREQYRATVRELVLPAFMIRDGDEWRLVHYEADVLSRVPWQKVDASPLRDLALSRIGDKDVEIRTGLDEGILQNEALVKARTLVDQAARDLDYAFAASHLLDVLPNPWRGYELAQGVFKDLLARHERRLVSDNYVFVLSELRKKLEEERDRLAEQVFRQLLEADTMRFMVVAEDLGLEYPGHPNRLPSKLKKHAGVPKANRLDGDQFMFSLFDYMPDEGFNQYEKSVATYLDEQEQLIYFWFRNVARRDYAVQGWRRGRIFADFVVALKNEQPADSSAFSKVYMLETKGKHLMGNLDTKYKQDVFTLCNQHASKHVWNELVPAMRDKSIRFEVVDEEQWKAQLNRLFA